MISWVVGLGDGICGICLMFICCSVLSLEFVLIILQFECQ